MKAVSINISKKKGTPKDSVEKAEFKVNLGIIGDVHAGPGIRQISLLAKESVDRFQKTPLIKVCLFDGIFGENIRTQGIELHTLAIGTILKIGDVVLEVSKIGKECLKPCAIARNVGDCIMPKEGIFAKVIKGGTAKPGDEILLSKS